MGIDRSGTPALYTVCTSSTRPSGPTQGMMIFETDTNNVVFYNGSSWVVASTVASSGAAGYAPPGALLQYGAASAPTGWLLCDGSSVSTTTYAALFAVIAYTYGGSGGSFNVPDLRGRTAVGSGTGTATGAANKSLGSTPTSGVGGEEKHTLTVGELAVHNHGVTDPGHSHTYATGAAFGAGALPVYSPQYNVIINTYTTSAANTNISINNAGSGTAHNIMGPFTVVNYIIKT